MGWIRRDKKEAPVIQPAALAPSQQDDFEDSKYAELEDEKAKLQKEIERLSQKQGPAVKERVQVVHELPVAPLRTYIDDKGIKVNLITIEEALNRILEE